MTEEAERSRCSALGQVPADHQPLDLVGAAGRTHELAIYLPGVSGHHVRDPDHPAVRLRSRDPATAPPGRGPFTPQVRNRSAPLPGLIPMKRPTPWTACAGDLR